MSTDDYTRSVLLSQPAPSSGNLSWVYVSASCSAPLPAVVRLAHGPATVQEVHLAALETALLGKSFAKQCTPGTEVQVLVQGPVGAVSRCEVRFGFRSKLLNDGACEVAEHRYEPGAAENQQQQQQQQRFMLLQPRDQRVAFMTVAFRCKTLHTLESDDQRGNRNLGVMLNITKGGSARQHTQAICTLQPNQCLNGVFDVPTDVLALAEPGSTIAFERTDTALQILDFHVEVGYFPNGHRNAFESMLQDPTFADITLVAEDGMRFPAHKAILVARSPVFEGMFCGGMREASETEVHLDDIDGSTLGKVLKFLYGGQLDEAALVESVDSLTIAANRLQVEDLLSVCCTCMTKGLDTSNALSIFQLADTFNLAELRSAAVRFMVKHEHDIRGREEYARVLEVALAEMGRSAS